MTTLDLSRATLQDALNAVDAAQDLSQKRKQDLRSAIRLVAKVLEHEPYLIPADPRGLGRRLDEVSALSLGLSHGRWANCRSLLRAALALVVRVMPGASVVPLLPEWQPLAAAAREVGSCGLRLGRLMRWLSSRDILPDKVTLVDLEQFRTELLSDALLGKPELTWKATRQSWERMRQCCQEWPPIALEKAPNNKVYSLPWDSFPPSLKADVDMLLARLAGHDLSEDGPLQPLRPQTLKLRAHDLRSFASALVLSGVEQHSLTSLNVCLSIDNYKRGLAWFYKRGGSNPTRSLYNLAATLKSTAQHWVKVDDVTLAQMAKIVKKLAPREQHISDKNRRRLRPFDSVDNMRVIANLPQSIRRQLETAKNANMRKVGLSTAALAIELLLVAPIRLSNLCKLHLDDNFVKVGYKIHLIIPKEDVKNRMDLEFELLPETAALLDWYVATYRQANLQNRYLFVGKGALGPKDAQTLRLQIMETVKSFTGYDINPHLFRHIAGSIFLNANPGSYEIVRQFLGHRTITTTTNFYTGQEERRARQHFIGTIQKLREPTVPAINIKGKKF